MAQFTQPILTHQGKALMARLTASADKINFTKIVTSTAIYTVDDIESLTSLEAIRQETLVASTSVVNGIQVKIEAAMTNAELAIGYLNNTLGIYARDSADSEILYAVCIVDLNIAGNAPAFIPPFSGQLFEMLYNITMRVGNAQNVILTVDPAAIVTIRTLELHNTNETAHENRFDNMRGWILDRIDDVIEGGVSVSVVDNTKLNLRGLPSGDRANFALLQELPNTNILHNWDFRNRTSIVNQRGQTEYTRLITNPSRVHTIDRWFLWHTDTGVAITDNGLYLYSTAANLVSIEQMIEHIDRLLGKTLTISIMIDGTVYSNAVTLPNSWPDRNTSYGTFRFLNGAANIYLRFMTGGSCGVRISALQQGVPLTIQAVKLELGTVSTLANDPPQDFGQQLAICQRYQIAVDVSRARSYRFNTDSIWFSIPVPTSLRIRPTIENPTTLNVRNLTNTYQSGFTFLVDGAGQNNILLRATKNAHGLTDAQLHLNSTIFNANL